MRKEIQEVNWQRKDSQTKAGKKLSELENRLTFIAFPINTLHEVKLGKLGRQELWHWGGPAQNGERGQIDADWTTCAKTIWFLSVVNNTSLLMYCPYLLGNKKELTIWTHLSCLYQLLDQSGHS